MGGREQGDGGSDDARQRESVGGGRRGRVDEVNERGRDGTRHGRCEGKSGGRKRAEEGLSEEGRKGATEGGKLKGRYAEAAVYSQTIPQCDPCP